MTRTRTIDLARGLAAVAVLIGLLAGVPAGLYAVAGSPLPEHLPRWSDIAVRLTQPDTSYTLFLAAVRAIGWIAWGLFLGATLTEIAAHARGRPAIRLPGFGAVQPAAARLVTTAALIFGTHAPALSAMTAHPAATASASTAAQQPHGGAAPDRVQVGIGDPTHSPVRTGAEADPGPSRQDRRYRRYTVRPGDTLWGIAARILGDGKRYRQIAEANYGRPQPDGGSFTDSHWVRPGWELRIPAEPPAPHQPHRQTPDGQPVYTVEPDDTLWDIARRHLGSEATAAHIENLVDRIFRLNEGRPQADGDALTSPRLIKPGWKLGIPHPHGTAPAAPSAPSAAPSTPPQPAPPESKPPTRYPSPTTPAPSASVPTTAPTSAAPPAPAPSTPQPPHASRGTASPTPAGHPTHQTRHPEHGIKLPAGGLIGLGLAAALSIALAASRAHRRRRRSPTPDRLTTPEREPATPPAVGTARKAHLDSYTDRNAPIPSDVDLVRNDFIASQPTEIEIGTRAQQTVNVPLGGLSVGLTGPGAPDAARAIATELLAGTHRNRIELLIPHDDAAALLTPSPGDLARLDEAVDGLVIPPTMAAATAHLEAEIIHRARMMERHSQEDIGSLRTADPAEPLPAVMVIAAASLRWSGTLEAALGLGTWYCVGGVLLGQWPAGTTCHVEADGTISRAEGPAAHTWHGVQLFHLSISEAAQMLGVIRTARGADEQTPALAPAPASDHLAGGEQAREPGPAPHLPEPPKSHTTEHRPVQLHLLGPARVDVDGDPIATGLRRISKALLTYLALHPEGVTREQGVDALWPDRDPQAGATMFHTAVNNVRKTLRKGTGLREPMFITYADGRYHLDPQLIDVDLWHVLDALHTAANTEDEPQKITALRRVADLYAGELADDVTYEWAELERERFRRSAIDGLVYLARLIQVVYPDQALAALEQAVNHDVYSEPIYRSVMRLQARLGRTDAVRRTYRLLENHLTDIDAEPSPETVQLLNALLQPKRHQRSSSTTNERQQQPATFPPTQQPPTDRTRSVQPRTRPIRNTTTGRSSKPEPPPIG